MVDKAQLKEVILADDGTIEKFIVEQEDHTVSAAVVGGSSGDFVTVITFGPHTTPAVLDAVATMAPANKSITVVGSSLSFDEINGDIEVLKDGVYQVEIRYGVLAPADTHQWRVEPQWRDANGVLPIVEDNFGAAGWVCKRWLAPTREHVDSVMLSSYKAKVGDKFTMFFNDADAVVPANFMYVKVFRTS